MKKFNSLKGWTIFWTILTVISIAFTIVYICRVEFFAQSYLWIYEDITCDYGHTLDEAFNIMIIASAIKSGVFFLIDSIFVFLTIKAAGSKDEITEEDKAKAESERENRKLRMQEKKDRKKKAKEIVEDAAAIVDTNKPQIVSAADRLRNLKINKRL